MPAARESDLHLRLGRLRPLLDAYLDIAYEDRLADVRQSEKVRDVIEAGLKVKMAALPPAVRQRIADRAGTADVPARPGRAKKKTA